ncbi:DNA repair protein RecO [Cellvibrio zantedeschiae]|uniref:DNA repair protein RecO n=1 Tax=Cellvibrio zantedeschiae TaxID=1237077 RepID=A0ABQ3AQZ0_9GAMM|nr:DNA repair protein RecO [Cellvibrio zantedeschiae]GGY65055.1 DNA repair protein RecO [Cellvibrio zantedeschiae]
MSVELQPAYILHTRPYRDTSMLVDFFTPAYGRITAVARGVRSRKAPKRNLLNPFTRLLISFQGKTDLKLLTHFEAEGAHFALTAKHLFSGFYLNELLVRLLPELDAHPEIYSLYEQSLQALNAQQELEPILRYFEFQLLNELGYGIHFDADAKTGETISESCHYYLDTTLGFYVAEVDEATKPHSFSGEHLLAIAAQDFSRTDVRHTAKRISRMLLKPLLGTKPLMSRELFN